MRAEYWSEGIQCKWPHLPETFLTPNMKPTNLPAYGENMEILGEKSQHVGKNSQIIPYFIPECFSNHLLILHYCDPPVQMLTNLGTVSIGHLAGDYEYRGGWSQNKGHRHSCSWAPWHWGDVALHPEDQRWLYKCNDEHSDIALIMALVKNFLLLNSNTVKLDYLLLYSPVILAKLISPIWCETVGHQTSEFRIKKRDEFENFHKNQTCFHSYLRTIPFQHKGLLFWFIGYD